MWEETVQKHEEGAASNRMKAGFYSLFVIFIGRMVEANASAIVVAKSYQKCENENHLTDV
jgi:hypothetical protein